MKNDRKTGWVLIGVFLLIILLAIGITTSIKILLGTIFILLMMVLFAVGAWLVIMND